MTAMLIVAVPATALAESIPVKGFFIVMAALAIANGLAKLAASRERCPDPPG
jgi:hypothetical protein